MTCLSSIETRCLFVANVGKYGQGSFSVKINSNLVSGCHSQNVDRFLDVLEQTFLCKIESTVEKDREPNLEE